MTPEIHKNKSQMQPLYESGLKDPTRSKEQERSQSCRTSCFLEEKPQAQEEDSVNPPKDTSVPCQDQEVSTNTIEQGPGSSPAGDSRMAQADETGSKDVNPKPSGNGEKETLPHSMECAGSFQGESIKPTFLELFAKAKNAHYIRHRVPPESERLLSIGEIFGHRESSQSRAGKDCENRVPYKFLSL
jgi:hypothetical protein